MSSIFEPQEEEEELPVLRLDWCVFVNLPRTTPSPPTTTRGRKDPGSAHRKLNVSIKSVQKGGQSQLSDVYHERST